MRILCVGGGSGGHVTPIIAVIDAIKQLQPDSEICLLTDKSFLQQTKTLIEDDEIMVSAVMAGKLRRYANLKWYDHIRHFFISYIPNFFDIFKIIIGIFQSWFKIITFKPDVIFIKGGYVGLPVGLAAAFLWPRPPIVLHDSDAVPGLTNRVLSRYAKKIATGMPKKYYSYDKDRMCYVGMPLRGGLEPVSAKEKQSLKAELGYDPDSPLVLITGGGQGSRTLNEAALGSYSQLKGRAEVLLLTGANKLADVKNQIQQNPRNFIKFHIEAFISGENYINTLRAADIIITRAGATSLAEMSLLTVPTIIVPSPYLSSDHQTKNADIYASSNAAIVLSEADIKRDQYLFGSAIIDLLDNKAKRQELARNIKTFAKAGASKKMAELIIRVATDGKTK